MKSPILAVKKKRGKELQKEKEERKGGEINIGGRQIPFTDLGT